ncbi:unnamed protein product [Urochloa humidicola]
MGPRYGASFTCRFPEPGVAEKEFSPANAQHVVRQILCNRFTSKVAGGSGKPEEPAAGSEPLPPRLTEADVDQFASEFERTGFTGGINFYRNMDRNWGGRQGDGAHQVHRRRW